MENRVKGDCGHYCRYKYWEYLAKYSRSRNKSSKVVEVCSTRKIPLSVMQTRIVGIELDWIELNGELGFYILLPLTGNFHLHLKFILYYLVYLYGSRETKEIHSRSCMSYYSTRRVPLFIYTECYIHLNINTYNNYYTLH